MLDKNQIIHTRWSPSNKEWYISQGYQFTKFNDDLNIPINKLHPKSSVKVNIVCDYCHEEYYAKYYEYVNSYNKYPKDCCGKCAPHKARELRSIRLADEKFKKLDDIIKEKHYTLLTSKDEYSGAHMKIKYICPKHGEQMQSLDNLLRGRECFQCSYEHRLDWKKHTADDVEKFINSYNNNVLLNKDDFINPNELNLKISCGKCNHKHTFITSFVCYRNGNVRTCSTCSHKESHHEEWIRNILTKNNILFEQEKRFPDCRDKKPLPFDFFLPDMNMIIEYDGEGHYCKTFYDRKGDLNSSHSLSTAQKHDQIKNEYCEKNNIRLLRIPYWEGKNIEKILKTELNLP